jgi:hypothetical protein
MRSGFDARLSLWLPIGLLVVSIASVRTIPFLELWGADLQNLHAFHHCAMRDDPYRATGAMCQDSLGRDMFYPPLLYWSFAWTRLVSFRAAIVVWDIAIALIMFFLARAWIGPASRAATAFWLLLLAQFPLLFAIERGNNDVLVVLVWSVAFVLFSRGFVVLSGVLAGTCVALKLYPAFAVAVLAVGLLRFESLAGRRWVQFVCGAGLALALAVVALPADTAMYLTQVLPRFQPWDFVIDPFSHPMPMLFPSQPAVGHVVSASLLLLWLFVARRRVAIDPGPAFAGALAISTYFTSVSYDYNLLTVYPLLWLLFDRSRDRPFGRSWALLMLGLVAIVVDRGLFEGPVLARVHVLLQVAWLALTALHFLRDENQRPG